ncbi:hypothetical protein [Salicibibacter kimchii]|uniref:Uncharacterized protein n=1 Tax=Salicibibacter kimchii TaxID=2099786 RepID=A0A345C2I2_9BACI|nr:hypothetical protein [Salicibibacter kimchii]AXF57413.1 hypothetical protein DT065_16430 [Salicibibacter kimchii]
MEPMLDLLPYLQAEKELNRLESRRQSEREQIISGIYRQCEVIGGMPVTYSYPTEKAALELVDIDGAYSTAIRRNEERVTVLNNALDTLIESERKAFNVFINSKGRAVSHEAYTALEKVRSFVVKYKEAKEAEQKQKRKEKLKEEIKKKGEKQ